MTPTQFSEFRDHAAALVLAAKTPEYGRIITKACAVVDLLGRHFGYRIMLNINANGASLHVTDDEGHEYSATSSLSAIDCLLDMAGTSLEGHLTSRTNLAAAAAAMLGYPDGDAEADEDEDEDSDPYDFTDDHHEGDTHE